MSLADFAVENKNQNFRTENFRARLNFRRKKKERKIFRSKVFEDNVLSISQNRMKRL